MPVSLVSRVLKYAAAAVLACGALAILATNTASAFNFYQDLFVNLSARPLALGGAFAGLSGPESVFHNPAGLAGVRRLTFLHNHSARHFPGSTEGGMSEWDQLDGDTQCIAVPLPLATYAHGFTFSGEMGYDYRGHPGDGSLGYPREQYWGSESIDAVATSTGLPLAAGVALRRHLGRFTPAEDDPAGTPAWIRLGEGTTWGVVGRLWPSLDLGYSEEKLDFDWTVLYPGGGRDSQLAEMTSRLKKKRQGWAFQPLGWLKLAADNVEEHYLTDDTDWIGVLHGGTASRLRHHRGGDVQLGPWAKYRWGDFNGHGTVGAAVNICGIWLNYSEVQDLLPEIVGTGRSFSDIHIYGFEWVW
jgi:hypothetical protein